mmetsp:Transcript_82649/g.145833  ORF Transcript_82649/g.145833 Transcript_82649/m.145833 type:complete len:807 (-) Transcript_82649:13-2433(-)|eukprot:CAMPEP_0197663652 /NCGR_PEP_ID=MMETSP1338-20131121/58159_1 /TAXON_ID=43686 ORGANISM="Pelagodinium beii, Strain RCC1491" /NCGR_SAMPLE_ID=MMETSP1338 /ASSEMBLY_ACC=CAM_ASM_000754 /LENGTH=806 /DNA_ID=CAMNT_0043242131 /DNA_START=33 /DNA_END=2453 /DNA_ORIENTATION=+
MAYQAPVANQVTEFEKVMRQRRMLVEGQQDTQDGALTVPVPPVAPPRPARNSRHSLGSNAGNGQVISLLNTGGRPSLPSDVQVRQQTHVQPPVQVQQQMQPHYAQPFNSIPTRVLPPNIQFSGSSSPAAMMASQAPLSGRRSSYPQTYPGGMQRQLSKTKVEMDEPWQTASEKVPRLMFGGQALHHQPFVLDEASNSLEAPNSARGFVSTNSRMFEDKAQIAKLIEENDNLSKDKRNLQREVSRLQNYAEVRAAGDAQWKESRLQESERLERLRMDLEQKNRDLEQKNREIRQEKLHAVQRCEQMDKQLRDHEAYEANFAAEREAWYQREAQMKTEHADEIADMHSTCEDLDALARNAQCRPNQWQAFEEKIAVFDFAFSENKDLKCKVQAQEQEIENLQKQLAAEKQRFVDEQKRFEESGRLWALGGGTGEAAAASPMMSPTSCSEATLRSVRIDPQATPERLKEAIDAVKAVLSEAERELASKKLQLYRAAFEQLHKALEGKNEDELVQALVAAKKAEVDEEDVKKAEEKLNELQSQTPEERAAKAAQAVVAEKKKEAFHFVKKDDVASLRLLIESLEEDVKWQDWRDYSGRNLWNFALQLKATQVQDYLRIKLGLDASPTTSRPIASVKVQEEPMRKPSEETRCEDDSGSEATIPPPELEAETRDLPALSASETAELKIKAFRFVVQNNIDELDAVLERLPLELWSNWENRAGKDLITLAQERGSSGAEAVLMKKLGLVQDRPKDSFEERESVWIFKPGEVQPLRATVLEDTPEELDDVLVEYWDGDDPPSRVEKCMVRKLWS